MIAGMNTVSTDIHFNTTLSPATSYAMLFDYFVRYDVLLTVENGTIHVVP